MKYWSLASEPVSIVQRPGSAGALEERLVRRVPLYVKSRERWIGTFFYGLGRGLGPAGDGVPDPCVAL